MKKFLLALLIYPLLSQAQYTKVDSVKTAPRKANFAKYKTHKLYSYSIGVKLFGFEELPQILDQVKTSDFEKQYLSGVILKFNDNQISYRISGTFYSDDVTFNNGEDEVGKGKLNDIAIRLGFEKNIVYADLQPYYGFDIGYRRSKFKGNLSPSSPDPLGSTVPARTMKNGLSLSPLLGLKYNFLSHFAIAAETSMDLLLTYEKQELYYNNGGPSKTTNKYQKWEYLFRPVGMLSLQYNFAEQY